DQRADNRAGPPQNRSRRCLSTRIGGCVMKNLTKMLMWFAAPLLFIIAAIGWPSKKATPQTTDVVLIGAGDISDGFDFQLAGAFATAALLDANPSATVFADGDLAYNEGSDADFLKSYDP